MVKKFTKTFKALIKMLDTPRLISLALFLVMGFLIYSGFMSNKNKPLDQAAFTPLLNLIADAESNDNYNAYFSNSNNSSIDFTSMTIAEVMAWQDKFVRKGSPSSAVGRYQIINSTLSGLVVELEINLSDKFDESMQDRLAMKLLERRGARKYINSEITHKEFAANLAKEWAALPKVLGDNPAESYYASDGLNRSHVTINKVLKAIKKANS